MEASVRQDHTSPSEAVGEALGEVADDRTSRLWEAVGEPPPGWIRHLAFAVARPGGKAKVYTEGGANTTEEWKLIREAVESRRAFLVELDPAIFAVDGDGVELGRKVELLFAEMKAAGERPVLVASGRPGCRHLLARLGPVSRDRFEARARELKLDVRQFIRPPLSPNRLGLPVRLIEPADPGEALEALAAPRRRAIPLWAKMLLREGVPEHKRSDAVLRVATCLVNRGHQLGDFRRLMADPRHALGEKYRGHRDPERYLLSVWRKAMAFVRWSPPYRDKADAILDIERMRERVVGAAFPGKAGSYRRRMLLGVVSILSEAGAVKASFFQRQVAEASGISRRQTVAKHLKASVGEGWLVRVARHFGPFAPTYRAGPRLRGEPTRTTSDTALPPSELLVILVRFRSRSLWRPTRSGTGGSPRPRGRCWRCCRTRPPGRSRSCRR